MRQPSFSRPEDIPDVIPSELLFSVGRSDLHVPKEADHAPHTTTPIEVSYCVRELGAGDFGIEMELLENMQRFEIVADEFLDDDWGNHIGRAIVRTILDPDRLAPISMVKVYENELKSARFPAPNEVRFFEEFVDNFGVLDREISNTTS